MNKLTRAQKAKNKTLYKQIRKSWETTGKTITYKQYKNRVFAEMASHDLSGKDAIKKVRNSESFTTPYERSRKNLINSLKTKFPDKWKEARYLSRDEKGRLKALEDNLEWDSSRGLYTFRSGDRRYKIETKNSPEEVLIEEIMDEI